MHCRVLDDLILVTCCNDFPQPGKNPVCDILYDYFAHLGFTKKRRVFLNFLDFNNYKEPIVYEVKIGELLIKTVTEWNYIFSLLGHQLIGIASVFVWAFGLGYLVFKLIKIAIGVRVSKEVEVKGLDVHEHGEEVYNK